MTRRTRLQALSDAARECGLHVDTWSPGDGVTRYRFFDKPSGYFGPHSGIFTALGFKKAAVFVRGPPHQ